MHNCMPGNGLTGIELGTRVILLSDVNVAGAMQSCCMPETMSMTNVACSISYCVIIAG